MEKITLIFKEACWLIGLVALIMLLACFVVIVGYGVWQFANDISNGHALITICTSSFIGYCVYTFIMKGI